MSFETIMRDCANNEDRVQRENEALEREEARLAAVAMLEARMGNIDKIWSATDYGDNAKEVIAALLQCAQDGHPSAKLVLKLLVNTYGANNAEVKE